MADIPPHPPPSKHPVVSSLRSYRLSVGDRQCRNFGKCMEVIVKIGKTNTMTNTWERQRQTNTRMAENEEQLFSSVIDCSAILCRELLSDPSDTDLSLVFSFSFSDQ